MVDHAYARVQALAARCYGLTEDDFEHVLGTFPLIEPGRAPRGAFEELFGSGRGVLG